MYLVQVVLVMIVWPFAVGPVRCLYEVEATGGGGLYERAGIPSYPGVSGATCVSTDVLLAVLATYLLLVLPRQRVGRPCWAGTAYFNYVS